LKATLKEKEQLNRIQTIKIREITRKNNEANPVDKLDIKQLKKERKSMSPLVE
jgi:hypothetical protein